MSRVRLSDIQADRLVLLADKLSSASGAVSRVLQRMARDRDEWLEPSIVCDAELALHVRKVLRLAQEFAEAVPAELADE